MKNLIRACGLLTLAAAALAAAAAPPKPIERTDTYQLLELEATVRLVPPGSFELLRKVIDKATIAASAAHPAPTNRAEALRVFEAIQATLAGFNFLQPANKADWPMTMAAALQPLYPSEQELDAQLAFPDNQKRVRHFDRSKPFYYVDCDAGTQVFLAVAQRLGWDLRQVDVRHHTFVRWHLPSGELVNWDWSHGESHPDDAYLSNSALDQNLRQRGVFLRSYSRAESNAYYRGLLGAFGTQQPESQRLLERAMDEGPHIAMTQNNLAWAYALQPDASRENLDLALSLGLAALSVSPLDGNRADTLACVLAARGGTAEKNLALALEDYAISHPDGNDPGYYEKNKQRILKGELCR